MMWKNFSALRPRVTCSMTDFLAEASTSAPPRPLCSACSHHTSIYTCPRCAARTCSLHCSRSHKSTNGCTGERNKAAYVPMNQYGWGTMMNDYVFLEEVGRRVGDWGKQIMRGGYGSTNTRQGSRGRPGRGRYGGGTKRDTLRLQLEARDIDMELLPTGMERRKINQSFWEPKCVSTRHAHRFDLLFAETRQPL